MQDRSSSTRPVDDHRFVHDVIELLASGRVAEARDLLTGERSRDDLFAAVARVDVAARLFEAGLPEIQQVQRRVAAEAPDSPDSDLLRWWLDTVTAERLLVSGEIQAIALALGTLAELPTGAFEAMELLYVRGRLRRLASVSYLLSPSAENLAAHRSVRDEAIADFLRCGFNAEAAVTRGLSAGMFAIATWEEMAESMQRIIEARAVLHDVEGSIWGPGLDFLLGMVAFGAGDLKRAEDAFHQLATTEPRHPLYEASAALGQALTLLAGTAGSAEGIAAVDAAIASFRPTQPRIVQLYQMQIANGLADLAHPEARRFALAALDMPPLGPVDTIERAVLQVRVDALAGTVPSAGEIKALLCDLEGLGHVRHAGVLALRTAHDCARLGSVADASALRSWGLERIPGPGARTIWEHAWARPVDEAPDPAGHRPAHPSRRGAVRDGDGDGGRAAEVGGPAGSSRLRLRVIGPVLEVSDGRDPRIPRNTVAKLLLALAIAHPAPLHVEQAADLLWPDAPPEVGRRRLNTVVHRLRTLLDAGRRAVHRSGSLLSLDLEVLDVDLARYRAALGGDDVERARAIADVRGNLCNAQFPYDEAFVDARNRFVGEWVRHASDLVAREVVGIAALDEALVALDLRREDLGP